MPTFDGIKCQLASHLGCDYGENEEGKKIIRLVRIKDCEIRTDLQTGKRIYYSDKAPTYLEVDYSDGHGVGKWRQYNRPTWFRFQGDPFNVVYHKEPYWAVPHYFVRDGRVYQGSYKSIIMPPPFLMDKYNCSETDAYGMFHTARNWWFGFRLTNAIKYSQIIDIFVKAYPEPMTDLDKIIELLETPWEELTNVHKI